MHRQWLHCWWRYDMTDRGYGRAARRRRDLRQQLAMNVMLLTLNSGGVYIIVGGVRLRSPRFIAPGAAAAAPSIGLRPRDNPAVHHHYRT
eukprot:1522411-Pyramimonas_sp.AAC.2